MWSAIASWGRHVIALVVFILLARLLDPEAFGLVALASIFVYLTRTLVEQGFTIALIQKSDLSVEHCNTAFWICLAVCGVFAAALIAAAPLVAALFSSPALAPIVQFIAPIILLNAVIAVKVALLRRAMNFRPLAIGAITGTLLGGVTGVTMALEGFGAWSLIGQQTVSALVTALVVWPTTKWTPAFSVSKSHFWELFHFGKHITASGLVRFVNDRAAYAVIGVFLGPTAVGLYNFGSRLVATAIDATVGAVNSVTLPTFSKLQNESERLRRALQSSVRLTCTITFPLFIGFSFVAPEVVTLLVNEKWQAAIPVLQILMLVGPAFTVVYITSNILVAMGKPDWRLYLILANTVVNICLLLLFVQDGLTAVAMAYVLRTYAFLPVYLFLVWKLIGFSGTDFLRSILAPTISAAVMVAALYGLRQMVTPGLSPIDTLMLLVAAGAGSYLSVLFLQAPGLFVEIFGIVRSAVSRPASHRS